MPRPKKPIKASRVSIHDRRYRIKFSDCDSTFIAPYETEAAAIAWAERNKANLIRRAQNGYTVRELGEHFFDRGGPWERNEHDHGWDRTDGTLKIYQGMLENQVLPAFGHMDVRELDAQKIGAMVRNARRVDGRPYAKATRNKLLWTLSLMFAYWLEAGIVETNPMDGVHRYSKIPEKPRGAIPREALAKLYPATHAEAIKVWRSSRYVSLFFLLNDTGARPGELRALRWGQIDFTRRFVPIRTAIEAGKKSKVKTTKTGSVRPAFFSERTEQELRIWRAESPAADDMDFVFVGARPTAPLVNASIEQAFDRALVHLEYDSTGWTPYWLRHSFGTYQMASLPQSDIMLLMGHAADATTRGYQHADDETIYQAGLDAKARLDEARGAKKKD